jgi:hypothetical protein
VQAYERKAAVATTDNSLRAGGGAVSALRTGVEKPKLFNRTKWARDGFGLELPAQKRASGRRIAHESSILPTE